MPIEHSHLLYSHPLLSEPSSGRVCEVCLYDVRARVESSWEPYSNLGTDGQRLAMEYLRLEELAQALEKVYHAVEAMRVPDVRLEELENRPVVTRSKSF